MLLKFFKFSLLIILITAVYANHFDNDFHFDDSHAVVNNPFIRDLSFIPRYFVDAKTFSVLPANQSYRPLLTTSLAIDYYLGKGYDLFYFHLSTFLLFIIQLVFQFFLYRHLLQKVGIVIADRLAFIAVAIYGLHPVSAETVNYIIQRGDLHSTLGVVLGFVIYLYFPKWQKFYLYLIPVLLGALSKPPAIMFAPILFSYQYLIEYSGTLDFWKKSNFKILFRSFTRSFPAIFVCLLFYLFQDRLTPESWTPGGSSAVAYILTQPYVWLYYLKSFFIPTGLHLDIHLDIFTDYLSLNSVIGYLFFLFVCYFIFKRSFNERGRVTSFLGLWCLFALAPTSFIPLAEPVNDHRMFFPYVALTLLIFIEFYFWFKTKFSESYLFKNKTFSKVFLFSLFLFLSFSTHQRNEVWHSAESIWKEVTIKSPQNGRGLMNYGLVKLGQGAYLEALSYFEKGLKFTPNYHTLEINLAITKNALARYEEAEKHYLRALTLGPKDPASYQYYADWLIGRGQSKKGIEIINQGLKVDSLSLKLRQLLIQAYEEQAELDKRAEVLSSSLEIYPKDPFFIEAKNKLNNSEKRNDLASKYLNTSLKEYNLANYLETIRYASEALKLKPNYAEAHNNLSAAYAKLENWKLAIKNAEKALEINPDFTLAKNNLDFALKQNN